MKHLFKLIVLNFTFILFLNNISAQVTVGFQGGLNISTINGHKQYKDNSPRFGGAAFLLLDIPIDYLGFMSIETGLGISQTGMKHETFSEDLARSKRVKIKNILDYVVLPLYLKENFSSVYTKFGIYAGYLLNAQSKLTIIKAEKGVELAPVDSEDPDFKSRAKAFDYGISFGFGFVKNLKSKQFKRRGGRRVLPTVKLDFKYNIGMAQLAAQKGTNLNLKNRVFMVGITFSSVSNR